MSYVSCNTRFFCRGPTSVRASRPQKSGSVILNAGRVETAEEALARRQRETERYEERVRLVHNVQGWEEELKKAGDNLVVIEVQSETVCQTGMEGDRDDEKEAKRDQWGRITKDVHTESLDQCVRIKHTFQRIARDCSDSVFLEHVVDEEPEPESAQLLEHLSIDVLPTLQFWKHGKKIFEHKGAQNMDADMAEGVLYYDGAMAEGQKAGSYVKEIKNLDDATQFTQAGDELILQVLVLAKTTSTPCMHMYPAVVALAQNFKGFASFARLIVDSGEEAQAAASALRVAECPSFIMFRSGKEVARYNGQSRTELISKILEIQQNADISPPPRPGTATKMVRQKQVRRVY
ncbi:hypothetical protein CEUSTIGMA_g13204.t1 [Chlamydomonas eustigma]|uniref:Thioredoxin domain-containing protein n=1 Tax=Chlamydomonas eustigma TaxID=1157962 RepID=A0A250XS70_9CHLO|nr:hypothetical protein CEUSTIGMA_g13204.t1 [Chlamydomonas eustigma]|eukprot:GAX85789.1 hypothetical protein CEUSTIGMA_g13204.t1 [Chlamydomonas eustigma]